MLHYIAVPPQKYTAFTLLFLLTKLLQFYWFGLISLFNGISTFVGYLMPKPFS